MRTTGLEQSIFIPWGWGLSLKDVTTRKGIIVRNGEGGTDVEYTSRACLQSLCQRPLLPCPQPFSSPLSAPLDSMPSCLLRLWSSKLHQKCSFLTVTSDHHTITYLNNTFKLKYFKTDFSKPRVINGFPFYSIYHFYLAVIIFCFFFLGKIVITGASLIAQLVKNPPAIQETPLQFLGREYPLEYPLEKG